MSSEIDRNPSPPPEILDNVDLLPDRIGNSLYSKKWFYKTLMSVIKFCDKTDVLSGNQENGCKSASKDRSEVTSQEDSCDDSKRKDNMVELDPEIEDDMCTLWDMSASSEVADFLKESGVLSIFIDVIDKTKSPRLLEIIVGILGNLSSFNSTCLAISQNKSLMCSVILLSGTSDTPTLLQVFRVILCGVTNQSCQSMWFSALQENSVFMENMKFILENSLSSTVLKGALQLLHSILNENEDYCKMWGQQSYCIAVIEAGKQLLNIQQSLDNFFCVIDSLCQYSPNVKELVENWTELNKLFSHYIMSLNDEETLPEKSRIAAIFSCFDTYNTLLKSECLKHELVAIDEEVLKAMHKLFFSVNSLLLNIKKDNIEVKTLDNTKEDRPQQFLRRIEERNGTQYITMMTEHEYHTWTVLEETLIDTSRTLLTFTEKESEKEILEDILSSGAVKENVGLLII